MEVYFGGAYQGKLDYVMDRICREKVDEGQRKVADGAVCNMEDIKSAQGLNHLHLYIQRIISHDMSAYDKNEYDKKVYDKYNDKSVNVKSTYEKYYGKSAHTIDDMMDALIHDIYAANPDVILICDEVGGGIVPIEKKDRIYREAVGRALCSAVKKSDRVERIMCGIGQCLKDTNM